MREPHAPKRPQLRRRPSGDVVDYWAWLSDREDPATLAYLEAENEYHDAWMSRRADSIQAIVDRIEAVADEVDDAPAARSGSWWYQSSPDPGTGFLVHRRGRSLAHPDECVILDEGVEAANEDYFRVASAVVSPNEGLLAWAADTSGDERHTIRIRDLTCMRDRADVVGNAAASLAWANDSEHLFYVRSDPQGRPFQVWRHKLGESPGEDVLVLEESDQRFSVDVRETRSRRWLAIDIESVETSECLLLPGDKPLVPWRLVRARQAGVNYRIDHWGDRFVILTNLGAEDFRIATAPESSPGVWTELVEHRPGRRIVQVEPFAGHLVIREWANAEVRLRIVCRNGEERIVDLGEAPHSVVIEPNPDWTTRFVRYRYACFTSPDKSFDEDVMTGTRVQVGGCRRDCDTGSGRYCASRTWATARDGTAVPIDVVWCKDFEADGTRPCVIYGYGSYEVPVSPWFSATRLAMLERGVVWALVHPRGGGELGRKWYFDGRLLNKRNTFDDTIACAEHLLDRGWAAPGRVAIHGESAGGLLVGACITMRPDLFHCAVAEAPFVDVVNTLSDPDLPLTVGEWEEWGDPRSEPAASYLASYSPYDNTICDDYPALYVSASLNDERVSYHEAAKWVARLRAMRSSDAPLLFRCDMRGGHGGAAVRASAWRIEAEIAVFVLEVLGADNPPEVV